MTLKCENIEIVRLTMTHSTSYFTDIASLHIEQIHHGLLPLLGLKFLSRLYYELAISPKTGVWAAIKSDKLVGFIAGCENVRLSYHAVLSRVWPLFMPLILHVILKPMLLRKMFNVLYYPFKSSSVTSHAIQGCSNIRPEILAIAVGTGMEGQGIGRKLIQAFEEGLSEWNYSGDYRVATNSPDVMSNSFYKKIGFLPCHQIKHNDLILQVYIKKSDRREIFFPGQ
jgi:N-acetylglutamate synthase-like GNAT family acetyltransferase